MRTSLQAGRIGPVLGLIVLLGGIPDVDAAAKTHRYEINGSLETSSAEKSTASAPLALSGRLSAPSQDAGVQSGGDYVVLAKLAESPLGCGGSDTIFTNGFDP
jgi:hypothetical protein